MNLLGGLAWAARRSGLEKRLGSGGASPAVIGGGIAAVVGAVVLLSIGRARRRRRRQALEDIQPIFQTETWRKLE